MEQIPIDQGAAWAVVAPMIQARQREMAERLAADTIAAAPRRAQPARTDIVETAPRTPRTADAYGGEGGLGRAGLDHAFYGRADVGASNARSENSAERLRSDQTDFGFGDRPAKTTEAGRADAGSPARKTDKIASPGEASGAQTNAQGLSENEEKVVDELKARDREVRDHEQAHARVGGQYASSPTYTFQTGPDGQQYAVGGAVQIDVSPVDGDPDATITKMDTVKAAALAPAEPSSADRQVAALADGIRAQALADLSALRGEALRGDVDTRA